jgi:hypothetical protein
LERQFLAARPILIDFSLNLTAVLTNTV